MVADIAGIGAATAMLAGTVSFLSPCVLPLVPGYVSYVAGRSLDDMVEGPRVGARLAAIGLSLCFVLGFSAVFIALGASASAIGSLFQAYRYEANYVAGAVVALFGLHMMGVLRLGMLGRDVRFTASVPGGRPVGALVLGLAFAFGWSPCIGPILAAILTLGATTASVSDGVTLLSFYSIGLAVPFLLVSAFTGKFVKWISRLRRAGHYLRMSAGIILVVMGAAMISGYLTAFGTWMLRNFPIFQQVTL